MTKKQPEQDTKPPRFMVVLVDFKTDVQIQVGAAEVRDFLKPLKAPEKKPNERFELERVIRYFEEKVKEAEQEPWPAKVKEAKVIPKVKK